MRFASAAALLCASIVSAVPASAVSAPSLPIGWTMYNVECNNGHSIDSTTSQLSTVNVSTGVTTPIGNPATNGNSLISNCGLQGTYDIATKTSYFVNVDSRGSYYVASVNTLTGAFTNGGNSSIQCAVTADASGTFFGASEGDLATVNPATGAVTSVGPNSTSFTDCAMAVNPVDDQIYTFSQDVTGLRIMKFNKTTGALSFTGQNVNESAIGVTHVVSPLAMAIDSNGIAWVLDDNLHDASLTGGGLIAIRLSSGETWKIAEQLTDTNRYTDYPSGAFYTRSIWLVPPAPSYTVTFNANNGSGTMSNQSASVASALTPNAFTRAGYRFAGWATSSNGAVAYADNASYPFSASQTLYAQWTADATGGGTSGDSGSSLASTGFNGAPSLAGGVALTLIGGTLLLAARRRKTG